MDEDLRSQVCSRAKRRCEYCLLHEDDDNYVFHVEHIIPKKHRGETVLENLAYACHQCNLHKGPNLTGRDPDSDKVTQLFNPREHYWVKHFRYSGARIEGLTDIGRTTVFVLGMNDEDRVNHRRVMGYADRPNA